MSIIEVSERRNCQFCGLGASHAVVKNGAYTYSCGNCLELAKKKIGSFN